MLEKSELVGNYVDHLTELSLAYRGEEDEEEDDVILLQPSDFMLFMLGIKQCKIFCHERNNNNILVLHLLFIFKKNIFLSDTLFDFLTR